MPTTGEYDDRPINGERPTVAMSMGDPGGIGPEVIVKALAKSTDARARFVIHGSSSALNAAAGRCGIEPFWWRVEAGSALEGTTSAHKVVLIDDDPPEWRERDGDLRFDARPTKVGGELSFKWVERAIAAAKLPEGDPARADAIVTGPISKAAWAMAGRKKYAGHTELLADRFNAKRVAMMFEGPAVRVVLATVHIPLMDVRNKLTIGRIHDAIDLGAEGCRMLGIARPRIAVCGLNPHAGEGGLLGDEETRLIEPAIEAAVRNGIDATGPHPADTVFTAALNGRYDLVVAMYHDQGLIPVKMLARDRSVNVTLGLPTIRTSPDHGTAYDIAGTGMAEEGSMKSSIDLALRMIRRASAATGSSARRTVRPDG
ncbi:MAG: 4-hydroxythreonine-4-phosphate dehydrogenase [Phycisphaeraceae bacterium]|nr:MAG: 4-hydroxythreonine-4-phosphate dehydrogenase [Phycisphaeraceae bacterium]